MKKSFNQTVPIEIKAGMTLSDSFFKGLLASQKITDQKDTQSYVIYGGNEDLVHKNGLVFTWNSITIMLDELYTRS